MPSILVDLGPRSYNIHLESNILNSAGTIARAYLRSQRLILISNPTVYELYGSIVTESFKKQGYKITSALMPDGEEYKNLAVAAEILDRLVIDRLERSSAVIALGGGVVGDLAGFVAAIYQRGIDFIQIPTTLLAQVDSSVGGKVGVNHKAGKNLIGAFHQPRLVIIDPATLDTLETRDYRSGLAEIIKYGIIYSQDFFDFLEHNTELIKQRDKSCLSTMIIKSCQIKSAIVKLDEKEEGLRACLNLGHTFGHALESLGNYTTYRHGEAVAMGIVIAAHLSYQLGHILAADVDRIYKLFYNLEFPCKIPAYNGEDIYSAMLNDKKIVQGQMKFIIPKGLGAYQEITGVSKSQVLSAITAAQNEELII